MRQALLYGLLTLALAQATPTRKEPSPVVKRGDDPTETSAAPKPSHYPGGDSDECPNEPLYFNFDVSKPGELKRVQRLHQVYCNEFPVLAVAGRTATTNSDRTIYERFFPESDDEDDYKDRVDDIWNMLFDFTAQTPSALVSSFIFENNDWKKECGETPGANLSPGSESLPLGAYTDVDPADGREKTHFCLVAYEYIDLHSITCDTLDSYPSVQMDTTGRYMLHEFTHYSTVGPPSHLNDQIVDQKNDDENWAYGASRSHGLIDPKQDDQPEKAMINADNYSWISTNQFFKQACPKGTNGNYDDPPNYVPGQEGDPSNSGYGDNPGDNGCGTSTATGCNGTPDDDDTYGYFTGE